MATQIEKTERRPMAAVRRFTTLDGMILVAATAVGCAGVHALERLLGEDLPVAIRETWANRQFAMMALIFSGSIAMPSLETTCPRWCIFV